MMRRTFDVLELLDLWWRYESRYQHVKGYPSVCASTRDWRASRQYDDSNGALDDHIDHILAKQIGHWISQIPDPWRTALHFLARNRNRATGAEVWRSPRLPDDRMKRAEIVAEACDKLAAMV